MEELRLRLQLALKAARMCVWDSSVSDGAVLNGLINWSADGASLIGLSARSQAQPFRDFILMVHPEDRDTMLRQMQQRVDECNDYHLEYRLIKPDGSIHWMAATGRCLCESGAPVRTLGLIRDITEHKLLEMRLFEQKELAEVTLGSIADAVITTDERGFTTSMNRVAEQLTGWSNETARGKDVNFVFNMVSEVTDEFMENIVHRCLRLSHTISTSGHAQLVTSGGHRIPVEDSAAPIWSRDGKIMGVVVVFRDVSHERKLVQQLSWQASHDALTGLINRREFEVSVTEALRSARQEGHTHALLYMDLDRFKIVNDTCGHGAGDVLLQTLTRTLQSHMRESDVLARLGGDELGVLLQCCPLQNAIQRANEFRQAIKDFRFLWQERSFEMGISIGLVEINDNSTSLTDLLVAADQACSAAKEKGRNRVHVYRESDAILARRQGELQWLTRLHEAFAMDRFRLFAQPIVSLSSNASGHHEVLIRLSNESNELTLPGAFIPRQSVTT